MANDKDDQRLKLRKVPVESQGEKFRRELKRIVEKNFADPEFGVETLCKKLVVSRANLFRKVKVYCGNTPNEYIKNYRLERAAQLLREDFGNVTEVSEAVGFSDQFYFSRCFKQRYDNPPKEYQLSHLRNSLNCIPLEASLPPQIDTHDVRIKVRLEVIIEELDREVVSRVPLPPIEKLLNMKMCTPQQKEIIGNVKQLYDTSTPSSLSNDLKNTTTPEIIQKIQKAINDLNWDKFKGNIVYDYNKRMDFFEIPDDRVRKNGFSIATVCFASDLIQDGSDYFTINTKIYGPTFNLRRDEMFYNQPILAGRMGTGVLVGNDMMAIPPHLVNEKNVTSLRFVFDYIMEDPETPIEKIPIDNIYRGIEIVDRVFNPETSWALLKLDRPVKGRDAVTLSQRTVFQDQPVYVIGHPCGLPLKYAPGNSIGNYNENYFRADLDVYSGSIGSPVFCEETHELIGIISRANITDFRWTGNDWITLRYPKTFPRSLCTRASQFAQFISK